MEHCLETELGAGEILLHSKTKQTSGATGGTIWTGGLSIAEAINYPVQLIWKLQTKEGEGRRLKCQFNAWAEEWKTGMQMIEHLVFQSGWAKGRNRKGEMVVV